MREKLEALAALIADYREGEIPRPDAAHVERWISQFDAAEREPVLDELLHLWSFCYLKCAAFDEWLAAQITDPKLVGVDPKAFWGGSTIMDGQVRGGSQRALRSLLEPHLLAATGLRIDECSGPRFIYLDDVLFTGDRIEGDVRAWLPQAPPGAHMDILCLTAHRYGRFQLERSLGMISRSQPGRPTFRIHEPLYLLENRREHRDVSHVLWPTSLPPGAEGYAVGNKGFRPRTPNGFLGIFSSAARREVLEQAMLKAGVKIIAACREVWPVLRPLGFSPFGVGFGSTVLTWRNCPNNAPLALWWGVNGWYPLVPRKTDGGKRDS